MVVITSSEEYIALPIPGIAGRNEGCCRVADRDMGQNIYHELIREADIFWNSISRASSESRRDRQIAGRNERLQGWGASDQCRRGQV